MRFGKLRGIIRKKKGRHPLTDKIRLPKGGKTCKIQGGGESTRDAISTGDAGTVFIRYSPGSVKQKTAKLQEKNSSPGDERQAKYLTREGGHTGLGGQSMNSRGAKKKKRGLR